MSFIVMNGGIQVNQTAIAKLPSTHMPKSTSTLSEKAQEGGGECQTNLREGLDSVLRLSIV